MSGFIFDRIKRGKIGDENIKVLEEVLLKATTREKAQNLILGLLTPKEIEELAERIRIVQLLKKGVGQHDIAGKLGVGVATVSRGAGEIKMGNFKYV